MKEQNKAPEKIQLSNKDIANLSDAQFKTLVIRMLTELVEYGCKLEEKMKAMQSEIKENVQGTNKKEALAGVAQWIECRPTNQRVAGSIPSQGTCLASRLGPQ